MISTSSIAICLLSFIGNRHIVSRLRATHFSIRVIVVDRRCLIIISLFSYAVSHCILSIIRLHSIFMSVSFCINLVSDPSIALALLVS